MKKFKRILIWSLLATFIELAMLFYLNHIYSKSVDTYSEVKSVPQQVKKTYNDVKVPEDAENIKVSYDGKYVSYYENKVLKIANTRDESDSTIDPSSNSEICYSKWLPDSNLLLLCEKDKKNNINFFSYDADKNSKRELTDFDTKPLKIEIDNKNDKVDNITLSTANHVMYVKILHKDSTSDVYKINVMNQVEKMKTSNDMIGYISMLHNDTNLIYEDAENEEIRNLVKTTVKTPVKTSASKKAKGKDTEKFTEKEVTKNLNIQFEDDNKKVLLATDDEDRIYVGTVENDKVSSIIYGDLKTSTDKWKTLKLPEAVDRKDIAITKEGNMYIKNDANGVVKNIATNIETKYKGNFVEIRDQYVYTLYDNKLIRTPLK